MTVRSSIAGALGRTESWIFAPGDSRRLAALRIGLCAVLAARLCRPVYVGLAGQPAVLFRPISFMTAFPRMPGPGVVWPLEVIGVSAALFAACGIAARLTLPIAWVAGVFLGGMYTSIGKVMHNDVLLLLAMIPLLVAPTADVWSVSRPRADGRPPFSSRYGWPVRTAMIVVAAGYFFTGWNKLIFSGPAWVFSDNLRWILFGASDANPTPIHAALFVAGHPLLAHAVAAFTMVTELGFPIVLWRPRAAWFFVPASVLVHVGIGVTMHLDYSAWALTTIVVFVPWDLVADRLAAGRRPERAATVVDPTV